MEIGMAGSPSIGANAVTAAVRHVECHRISAEPLSWTCVMKSRTGRAARIGSVIMPRSGTRVVIMRRTQSERGHASSAPSRATALTTPSMSRSHSGVAHDSGRGSDITHRRYLALEGVNEAVRVASRPGLMASPEARLARNALQIAEDEFAVVVLED